MLESTGTRRLDQIARQALPFRAGDAGVIFLAQMHASPDVFTVSYTASYAVETAIISRSCRMLALIQRVTQASVRVDGAIIGQIGSGLVALIGVEPGDGLAQIERMSARLLGYRVFADAGGRMNRSLADTQGGLLLVSQFTLAADTRSGMRPGFSTAAAPEQAEPVFQQLVEHCHQQHSGLVQNGQFGAHMVVDLSNDGPVTFLLRA